jgi:hypothetical protein
MQNQFKSAGRALGLAAILMGCPVVSHAYTVTLNQLFASGTPGGYPGTLSVTFADVVDGDLTTNRVDITITADLFSASEKVMDVYLNSALDPSTFTFTYVSGPAPSGPTFQSSFNDNTGNGNGLKADGDGFFDILFTWPTNTGNPNLFEDGESVVYTVTSTNTANFNAQTFNLFSFPSGGEGTYLAATHILGITSPQLTNPTNGLPCSTENTCSAYVGAVPVPAAIWLLGSSVLGLFGLSRRKTV